ncbi:MAG: dTDP-glucose 4,6-dehydratase [Dehalococcoidia bacterium]
MKVLVTGGCGFIGSHVVRALLEDGWEVTNLDLLTYASNRLNLGEAAAHPRYRFVEGDICDAGLVKSVAEGQDLVLNLAAETHVDRSLLDPGAFVRTDVEGVVCLLEAVRANPGCQFVQMSTDEVFGSLAAPLTAGEDAPFRPSSPYSASKAAAELQVQAYAETYGLPATVLRSCNVYGPNQHIEKFIPLFVTQAIAGQPLPLYGDGLQEREWLFVSDLVAAMRVVLGHLHDQPGLRAYHVGSGERLANRTVAERLCWLLERDESLIQTVADRPGHDRRYALDSSRLRGLGWAPEVPFDQGLATTVGWYRDHPEIWGAGASAGFMDYFKAQYGERLAGAG